MNPQIYYFLHVFGVIMLTGFTLYATASSNKSSKKKLSMITGILSLVVFVAGFGLMAKIHGNDFGQVWVIVKIVCWLALSALAGMAYKKSKSFIVTGTILSVGIAVYMVYIFRF